VRFLLLLIIILLAVYTWWPEPPVPAIEDTFIGPQLQPLSKAKAFEQDYLDDLDKKKEQMDKQADGG
jgi:hypothetical protein